MHVSLLKAKLNCLLSGAESTSSKLVEITVSLDYGLIGQAQEDAKLGAGDPIFYNLSLIYITRAILSILH